MRDFMETIGDKRIASRFKDAVLDYPDWREPWFGFHHHTFARLAKDWLRVYEIEARLKVQE